LSGLESFETTTELPRQLPLGIGQVGENEIEVRELATLLATGDVVVFDLASSQDYGMGHIPGAYWGVRARLAESLPKLQQKTTLIFTSPDATLARLAAPEALELTGMRVAVLTGGTQAWANSGQELATGLENVVDERDDTWLKPYDHAAGVEDRMRAYLTWEVDLLKDIERDGDHRFRLFT
jgi:rhodanese-related sulfurtransferase